MTRSMKTAGVRTLRCMLVAGASAAAITSTAFAQDGTASDESAASEVVVTGSRIKRPNLESTVPITSIGGEQFFQTGQTSIGDSLNDLPQLRSTFAQQNPGLGIGIAGLNLLDLRGLGTQRTLVLVNGRRHVASDILNNAVSVDTSSIPNDMIERVDVVTGGNSAVYGSDAIAGVVNFVLRDNFEGLQLRAQGGQTWAGFGGNQYVSGMYGKNFADGRANITVHGEYARTERVFASDVPAFQTNNNFVIIDADGGAGIVNGGDGFPDRNFFRDIRSSTIHFNGLVPVNQTNLPNVGLCGNATTANNGAPNTAGAAFNCTFIFDNAGRLIPQTGTRLGTGLNPTIIGGNGQTGREGENVSVLPFQERLNFNLVGHYEFSELAEVFLEAKWNRVNAVGNNAGPSFNQGTGGTTDFRERPRLDNPFLDPADRATLAAAILASGCRSDLQVTCQPAPSTTGRLTATDIANVGNGSFRFVNSRNLLDVGIRDAEFHRDTIRVVAGLRGTFNEDWSYEISANYGRFEEDTTNRGFIDRQRFALAMDAGRNGAGQIVCRSQFDPAAAVPLVGFAAPAAANAARLAADIAACVPYNPFGSPDNSASIAYFARDYDNKASLDQLVISGFMSGDSSQLFSLPAGPVSFALGGEYRRENAFFQQDQFVVDGFTNAVSIPTFDPDTFTVKEGFGEVRIPVLANMPFVEELTLSGAGRAAAYQGSVGTVFSYNGGIDYAPIRDIRFRGNYSRAVRAPNLSETGFPLVPNFFNGFNDPCNPALIGTGVRAANCLAQIGATNLATFTNGAVSLPIVSGSNPNLISEKSDSLTIGAVFQPRFVPGLSVSIDYYDIDVKNVIATVPVQTLVNQCYDSPTLANVFCGQFQRWAGPGLGPNGEQPGRILANSLISAPLNFANRTRRGVDMNLGYKTELFGKVKLNTNLIYTHVIENSNFQDPTNPLFETRVLGQLGDPQDEFRWDFDFGLDIFTVGYRVRYIGPMYYNTYATLFPINGLQPTDVDAFPDTQFPAVMYHDLRLDIDVLKSKGLIYVGVDNVLDKGVPEGAVTATGAGSAIYSFRGRNVFAGVRVRF